MLVHGVHTENTASGSPPRAGSSKDPAWLPASTPRGQGEVTSRHSWDICTVPPCCQASLATFPQAATLHTAAETAPGGIFSLCWNHSLTALGVLGAAPSPARRSCAVFSLQEGGRDVSQSYPYSWCTSSFFSPPQYTHLQHCFPQTDVLCVPPLPMTLAPQNHDLPATTHPWEELLELLKTWRQLLMGVQ